MEAMRAGEGHETLTAGRDLVRQTALLVAGDLPLPELFDRLATVLSRFVDASMVRFAVGQDLEQRFEFQLQPPAAESSAELDVPISFGGTDLGRLTVRLRGIDRRAADVVMLETFALYLGGRIHDEHERADRARYKELALSDGLTGLANRRALDETLHGELQRCARSQMPLSLLLMDIDFFKVFNDSYGHLAGDACLRQVATAIASCVNRPGDVTARYGGEEFAVVLPETSLENAVMVGEAIATAIRALGIPHQGSTIGHVTLSVGCASTVPTSGTEAFALIEAADAQLYRAKETGRNRVACDRRISDAPRAARAVVVKHNLPPARTTFVGRDRELTEIEELFSRERLVTILGSGGTGKTRLARELGPRLAAEYSDGVWFVDLSTVVGPEAIPQRIAATIFPAMTTGVSAEILARLLHDKTALLVLDNAEHLIDACASVANALLDAAPHVKMLATSREALAIDGERVYALGALQPSDAAHLFEERARSAGASDWTGTDRRLITRIIAKLDNVPLAIELAASRAASMALDELLAQLEDRLTALQAKSRSAPSRHQTLDAVIDWSYRLLTDTERAVLRCVSTCAGGWRLDAATAICAASTVPADSTRAALATLIAKSLVEGDPDGRMSLLESTRAFAFGQAEKAGEANRLRLAHAAYYRKAAETEFRVEETPNYRTALESYFDVGSDPADPINFLWSTRTYGSYTSGRSAFVPPVEALLERELPALEAARAHQFLAAMCEKLDPARGERHAKRSMELFDSCGDRVGWAWAAWCFALARQDFTSQPEALLREALATAVEARERYLESHLLSMLAIAAAERGDNEEALDLLVRAERACDPADVATLSMIWSNTALVHVQRNDYDRAAELMKQCVASLEESIPWGARFQLVNLGLVHLLRRDYLSARDALRRGVDYLRTYPGLLPMAMMFDVIALLAARTGSYEPAVKLASFAQTAFDGGFKRQPIDQGYFDEMLAELHRRVDDGSFVRLWDDGRSMTFEHAAALAETI